ncbi:MAG TPA: hypothetical protein VHN55_01335 [Sphingomicrobium sp.]|nr:hypothetical protein [Sphingomicrobium sp.]
MRTILISLAAAASALVVAAPASAQAWSISVQSHGNLGPAYGAPAYGAPYGYAYGYNQGAHQWARQLQQVRMQMHALDRAGRLTRAEERDLRRDINSAERALRNVSRRGVSAYEARVMNQRIARLHYELRRYSDRDYRRGYGYRR